MPLHMHHHLRLHQPQQLLAMALLLRAAGASLAAAKDDPLPVWPQQFSAEFNETTKLFLFEWQTDGAMFYDADQQAELMYRANGRGDRYCGSIHPRTDTPCSHLVVGGMRYLIWPGLGQCCACCSAESGCGILAPDWLEGADFIGESEVRGLRAYGWTIRGLQPNEYYSSTDDARIPLQIDQDPTDYISFHPDSYKPGPISPNVFRLPAGCSKPCPLLSTCTIAAVRGSLRRQRQRWWAWCGLAGVGAGGKQQQPVAGAGSSSGSSTALLGARRAGPVGGDGEAQAQQEQQHQNQGSVVTVPAS